MSRLILAALMLLTVCACGKRGNPVPPGPNDQLTYPRTYPTR